MRTAVALMALCTENDVVFHSLRARRFHEDPTCYALRAGHQIHHCLCGDPYCGCRADPPPITRKLSIGDAAMADLEPCDICYPDFQDLAAQLPSDDDFGHRPLDDYSDNPHVSRIACARCMDWSRVAVHHVDEGRIVTYLMGQRVSWPCTSARVLGLVPPVPEESVS